MNIEDFRFRNEISAAARDEIRCLLRDGYLIHKEWTNGVELRKGKGFRAWLLFVQVIFPAVLVPGFMRSAVENLYGYKFRLFVTTDSPIPKITMI